MIERIYKFILDFGSGFLNTLLLATAVVTGSVVCTAWVLLHCVIAASPIIIAGVVLFLLGRCAGIV